MIIGEGDFRYEWTEDWAKIPDTRSGRENGRTHGVVVLKNGNIAVFNQADPAVLIFNSNGKLINSWGNRFSCAHGMTLTEGNGTEYLWLTDQYSGEVVKTSIDGKTLLRIEKPRIKLYEEKDYSPTWVSVFEERFGGNGDIWITDGYGSNFIHRFNKEGIYINSINGEEGKAGAFNCPHSIFFDIRKSEPELYIADRGNKRFQVYDPEGNYKRSFGENIFGCPCGGVVKDNLLYIPELCARLAVLDENDKLITYLGRNESTCDIHGWPNHPKELIKEGKFNSPHDLAVDNKNNIYVVEWITGGRIIKLERAR
ncbi:MAG: hypothetical protein Q7S39_01000 [Ignavibacteria bacterium]|nr:hypothetical protein [Ignavibacteria bacterium]